MKKLTEYNKVFFVGIGGIGMSALAQWFMRTGYTVGGYDRSSSDITNRLEADGALTTFDDSTDTIADIFKTDVEQTLVVYTPAIPDDSEILNFFKTNGYDVVKRSVALGIIAQDSYAACVAGTHGKTSISTMTTCILDQTQVGVNAFLGGVSKNFNTNVVIKPESPWVVIEADEFDRSFLTLYPHIALISAMDADHLDIYGNKAEVEKAFAKFVGQVKPDGVVIIKKGVKLDHKANEGVKYYSYALDSEADFYAKNIHIDNGEYVFDIVTPNGVIADVKLGMPALYNVENAVAATAVAMFAGASENEIRFGLAGYAGVRRRFDVRFKNADLVFIDDYAHHPEEIKACLRSVRDFYPGRTVTVMFQPHLYSRTRDFANEFAAALDMADRVIITDIYPARELPIEGVSSEMILERMKLKDKMFCPFGRLKDEAVKITSGVLLTMGAGNIDTLIEPIHQAMIK